MNKKYIVAALDVNLQIIPGGVSPFAMPHGLGIVDTVTNELIYKTYIDGPEQIDEIYDLCDIYNNA